MTYVTDSMETHEGHDLAHMFANFGDNPIGKHNNEPNLFEWLYRNHRDSYPPEQTEPNKDAFITGITTQPQ